MSASTKTWLNNNPPSVEDDDLNGFAAENNNLILGSGQALNTADSQQTHKAVSVYAHGGNFYTDGGAADAYVLSVVGTKVAPPAYFVGMTVQFTAGNDNTGASTINVAALGVIALLTSAGAPLSAGKIIAGIPYEFTYDGADFISVDRLLHRPITGEVGVTNYEYPVGDVRRYGAVGDGVTDDDTAFNNAIASLPSPRGGTILAQADAYKISTTKTWDDKPVRILGKTIGLQTGTGTRIIVAAGVSGFNPKNGANGYGYGSALENLQVVSESTVPGLDVGVLVQCKIALRNVQFTNFGSHGIHVQSGDPVADVTINANNFSMINVRSWANRGSGYFCEGVDSNAGVIMNLDCDGNTLWGIYENSFLGNTFIAPHVAGNLVGGYRFGTNGRQTRIYGGYKETDALPGVQIDADNAGRHHLDFCQLADSVIDNTVAKTSEIIWSASSFTNHNQIAVGDATGQAVLLSIAGMTLDIGKILTMKNAAQDAIWTDNILADQRRFITSAQGAHLVLGNPLNVSGAIIGTRVLPVYGVIVAIDANLGSYYEIDVTDGVAFTISNPTNLVAGQTIIIKIKNTSGGAMGAITWGSSYKMAAFINPANGSSRSVTFTYDGVSGWVESSRSGEIPN